MWIPVRHFEKRIVVELCEWVRESREWWVWEEVEIAGCGVEVTGRGWKLLGWHACDGCQSLWLSPWNLQDLKKIEVTVQIDFGLFQEYSFELCVNFKKSTSVCRYNLVHFFNFGQAWQFYRFTATNQKLYLRCEKIAFAIANLCLWTFILFQNSGGAIIANTG